MAGCASWQATARAISVQLPGTLAADPPACAEWCSLKLDKCHEWVKSPEQIKKGLTIDNCKEETEARVCMSRAARAQAAAPRHASEGRRRPHSLHSCGLGQAFN